MAVVSPEWPGLGSQRGTGTEEAGQPQPQQPRRQQRGRPRLRHPQREAERGGGLDEPARRAHRQPGAFAADAALLLELGNEGNYILDYIPITERSTILPGGATKGFAFIGSPL